MNMNALMRMHSQKIPSISSIHCRLTQIRRVDSFEKKVFGFVFNYATYSIIQYAIKWGRRYSLISSDGTHSLRLVFRKVTNAATFCTIWLHWSLTPANVGTSSDRNMYRRLRMSGSNKWFWFCSLRRGTHLVACYSMHKHQLVSFKDTVWQIPVKTSI